MTAKEREIGVVVESVRARRADSSTRIDLLHLASPMLYPALSRAALESTELRLGFELPPLLRRLYLDVGNGGFGPGGGLIGVADGYADSDGNDLLSLYEFMLRYHGIRELLPVCEWGCGTWSCVVCDDVGLVATCDQQGVFVLEVSFINWIDGWCAGQDLYFALYEFDDSPLTSPFDGATVTTRRRVRARGRPVRQW